MDEDNASRQVDEVQALSAIYEDAWTMLDQESQTYNVCISVPGNVENRVNFQVTLPPDYPAGMPPYYQLSAPWLKGSARLELSSALEDIYWNNVGESILYMWIERVREFLHDTSADQVGVLDALSEDFVEEDAVDVSVESSSSYQDLFFAGQESCAVDELPDVVSGKAVTVKRSTFQAHAATVLSQEQVKMILEELKKDKKIANATHNISAYRIYNERTKAFIQDNDDDGETHAGARILHLLQILDVRNVLVVVTRWYGGVKLGPDRFRHINNCAREILVQAQFIRDSTGAATQSNSKAKKR